VAPGVAPLESGAACLALQLAEMLGSARLVVLLAALAAGAHACRFADSIGWAHEAAQGTHCAPATATRALACPNLKLHGAALRYLGPVAHAVSPGWVVMAARP
jgi:hypothetical protein